jgi:N6-L-threonylcarbamoyladenine synthase
MLLSTSPTRHRIIAGQDVDLSIGRAFDKAAKLLHIPWGSKGPGAALEAFAATAPAPSSDDPKYTVPAPGRIQFSYAGLLSQIDRAVTGAGGIEALSEPQRAIIARAFQQAAFSQLSDKILLFMKESDRQGHEPICDVVISGGVASNTYMRER